MHLVQKFTEIGTRGFCPSLMLLGLKRFLPFRCSLAETLRLKGKVSLKLSDF